MLFLGLLLFIYYTNRQQLDRDQLAYSEFQDLRHALYDNKPKGLKVLSTNEIEELGIKLSSLVRVNYLFDIERKGRRLIFLSLQHVNGSVEYRWSDIYGARREQRVYLNDRR